MLKDEKRQSKGKELDPFETLKGFKEMGKEHGTIIVMDEGQQKFSLNMIRQANPGISEEEVRESFEKSFLYKPTV